MLKLQCMRDGCFGIEIRSAIGKAVWSDIQNAHDQGALAEGQGARTELKPKSFAMKHRGLIIQKVQIISTGFSLWVFVPARIYPHRMQPVLLENVTPEDNLAS